MAASTETKQSKNVKTLIENIESLTVLELSELVKALEDKFGVSAAAQVVASAAPGAGAAASQEAPEEEKTDFNVMLTGFGDKKLQVIKEIRAVTDMGLKEAKSFVEGDLPAAIKEGIPKDEAESIKAKIEAAGATVEIK
ncbi:50S ribosomal protein L7/L12 [bacterium]|nr:50S ribosomal protein L7/L12 [bacterium]